jgi:hypothetical protein
MPRFSKEERAILIPAVEAFASEAPDPKIRGRFKDILRKLQQSDSHHSQQAAQRKKA